eukprot:Gb_30346 [translate_table: standard]
MPQTLGHLQQGTGTGVSMPIEMKETEHIELKASTVPSPNTRGMEAHSNEMESTDNTELKDASALSPNTRGILQEHPKETKSAEMTPKMKHISNFDKDNYTDTDHDLDIIGTTPVNIRGKPIKNLSGTGGWVASCFIFGNEMAERMAYFGLAVNLVYFLIERMNISFANAATLVINFMGTSQVTSIVGAFLADAYLGRYWTIGIFSTLYLVGLIGLTISASYKGLMPSACNPATPLECEHATSWQMSYLTAALYVAACGSAGIRPCVSAFGADQFDERAPNYKSQLDRFFNFFYLFITTGAILSVTLVVLIQYKFGWGSAFGSLAVAMAVANLIFFAGTPIYRHRLPGGSPLTRIAQVVVAALHKRNVPLPEVEKHLYEIHGKKCAVKGSGKLKHTDEFSNPNQTDLPLLLCPKTVGTLGFKIFKFDVLWTIFLDKAAVQTEGEIGEEINPWRLCTVTQVEELKMLLKVLPIWGSTILLSTMLTAFMTSSAVQTITLNTYIGKFHVPDTSMAFFPVAFVFLALSVYDVLFVPFARRFTGHPRGTTQLQRIGIGLAFSVLSVIWAGAFERYRRNYALSHGYEETYYNFMPGLSAYWLIIQYCLIGIAEVFAAVGMLEFFYEEAPDAMQSLGVSFAATAGGLGCFVASIVNNIIDSVTTRNGHISWIVTNANKGRYDYFYWTYAVVSSVNLFFFLYFARRYKYRVRSTEKQEAVISEYV